jgi:hypothetical protein
MMKTGSGFPGNEAPSNQPLMQSILGWPSSQLGWWAIGLGVTFEVLYILFKPISKIAPWMQVVLPIYSKFMLLCGLAAVIVGLIAVIKHRERSWLIWLAILPGLFVLISILIEFITAH